MIDLSKPTGAVFSESRNYRYALWRMWAPSKLSIAMVVGLNPSTAAEDTNDPTIRRLISLLQYNMYGGFIMTNLFGIVSPDPKLLLTHDDPVGENDIHLNEISVLCNDIVFAWGSFKEAEKRASNIIYRFPRALCFGRNANGSPKHPLYLKADTKLINFH
jgi:hypothetical protein